LTHTLHRLGSKESLKDDYVVLRIWTSETNSGLSTWKPLSNIGAISTPKTKYPKLSSSNSHINRAIKRVLQNIAEFFGRHPNILLIILSVPVFPGIIGKMEKTLLSSVIPATRVVNKRSDLFSFLRLVKRINIGASVVVSGLFSEVDKCMKQLDITPHTVEFSLGLFGKKNLLPKQELLRITTMCGHHLISPRLVEKLISEVKRGKITYEEASQKMAKRCICGAFNIERAARLMKGMVSMNSENEFQ